MAKEMEPSSSTGEHATCPLPKTHRRLIEAHLLWHQTLDKYHDPEAFRANLNATIEALRNVTFVLQNEKAAFDRFDDWYTPWQDQLKSAAPAKWLHDARTTVVHQGDLESDSTAEVRLITWRDEVLIKMPVPAGLPSSLILKNLPLLDLLRQAETPAADAKYAAIAIERRWSTAGLGGQELLDVLAKAYGLVSEVVLDAHFHLRRSKCISHETDHPDFCSTYHRTGTLECMAIGAERRTKLFQMATGHPYTPEHARSILPPEPIDADRRYGFAREDGITALDQIDPLRYAEKVLYRAKRILQRDRCHQRMMFIRDGKGQWHTNALVATDRTEKHLLMRLAAQFIESKGCDALVEVGEVWYAPWKSMRGLDLDRIQDAEGRRELLFVQVATRQGISRRYLTPFSRGTFGGIKLGETEQKDGEFPAYLEPVLDVWRRQGFVRLADGKVMPQLWQPDALDTCFCGGPSRFAECCKRHLPRNPASRAEIQTAMAASDFGKAEALAKADLAQYVIWIKRHTAHTVHVADDLHRKLVDIDICALEDLIETMESCMEANGTVELFLPKIRHLAGIIGVPRISMRLVALASHRLLKSGKIEEAILELDVLGDLNKVDDAVALVTAANVLDIPTERRRTLLERASSVAIGSREKWSAQFDLAEVTFKLGQRDAALAIIDSITSESIQENAGVQTEALMIRWKMTRTDADFESFSSAIDRENIESRKRYGAILINEGMYNDAQQLLEADRNSGDAVAMLLLADALIRGAKGASARNILLGVEQDQLPGALRHAYALAAGNLALACKDEEIRQLAIAAIRGLPDWANQNGLCELLKDLENSGSCPQ